MTNKKAKGKRAKTRQKYSRKGSKVSVNKRLARFSVGEKVQIVANGSIHEGLPPRRFHGLSGVVQAKQGRSFNIAVYDGNLLKHLIVSPAHLKRIEALKTVQVSV
ncbi:MAG: 50S ribosomal protein L21e [Candidatus Diapherotrites archaeon]